MWALQPWVPAAECLPRPGRVAVYWRLPGFHPTRDAVAGRGVARARAAPRASPRGACAPVQRRATERMTEWPGSAPRSTSTSSADPFPDGQPPGKGLRNRRRRSREPPRLQGMPTSPSAASDLVPPSEIDALTERLRAAEEAFLADLRRLVDLDCGSYTRDGVNQVATWVVAFLARLGGDVTRHPIPMACWATRWSACSTARPAAPGRSCWATRTRSSRRGPPPRDPSPSRTASRRGPVSPT